MKKYSILQCNICKRTKDSLVNLTHYAPDRCTITLNCEGRLSPIGSTSDGTHVLSVPPTGLENWYARGSSISTTTELENDVLYDTSTGLKKQVVIAVSNTALGFTPGVQAKLTVKFIAEQQTAKDYRKYTYRRSTPFTTINGVEDGMEKKVLRYNITGATPDLVEVYVNGVKRDLGAQYRLYDGSVLNSDVPPNSVLFTSLVTGTNTQVDVIVTKASAVSNTELVFSRVIDDESRLGLGSWEGVHSVKTPASGQYTLFYCDFSEGGGALTPDIRLRFLSAHVVDVPLGSEFTVSDARMLLSRSKLFTQLDRQRSKWVPLAAVNTNTEYLVVKLVDGARTLQITESSAVDVFPVLEVLRFGSPTLQLSSLKGNSDASELDNTLIIGPDA